MFDTAELAGLWFDIFNGILLLGAFLVLAGTWGTIKTGAIKEKFSDERTAANEAETKRAVAESDKANAALGVAQADIAKANAQIANATARTKEAELKVEQLRKELGPRHLQRDIFLRELLSQPSAQVEILYLQDDPECFGLAQEIGRALEDAKWPVAAPKPIPSLFLSDGPTSLSVGGQPSGVTVVARQVTSEEADASQNAFLGKEWIKTPWTVLTSALAASLGKIAASAGTPNGPPEGTLRVVVTPRG